MVLIQIVLLVSFFFYLKIECGRMGAQAAAAAAVARRRRERCVKKKEPSTHFSRLNYRTSAQYNRRTDSHTFFDMVYFRQANIFNLLQSISSIRLMQKCLSKPMISPREPEISQLKNERTIITEASMVGYGGI